MDDSDYKQADIDDLNAIRAFTQHLTNETHELVLTKSGSVVGAILTVAQYQWFLDQLDAADNLDYLDARLTENGGTISLDDFKKELGNDPHG